MFFFSLHQKVGCAQDRLRDSLAADLGDSVLANLHANPETNLSSQMMLDVESIYIYMYTYIYIYL